MRKQKIIYLVIVIFLPVILQGFFNLFSVATFFVLYPLFLTVCVSTMDFFLRSPTDTKFSAIYQTAPFATALINYPQVEIIDVNPAFERLFDLKKEAILGKRTDTLGIHQDFQQREEVLAEFARSGMMRNVERKFTSRDGREVIVLNNVDKIEIDGKTYILSTMEDITERKKNEEKLYYALKTRDEFLSIASHELKTPLTSLKLQVQTRKKRMLTGDLQNFADEKILKMIDADAKQIDRLTRLIDDMLDIARINTGKLTIERTRFDLNDLIIEVLEKYRPQYENSGVELHFHQGESISVFWDHFRIEQVITNLLTNALRYGEKKPVEILIHKNDSTAVILVKDYGPGISPELQNKIFDRFERANQHVSGLGLGLYIAKEIVQMHGGTVQVESEIGNGSTFKVELPLS